MYFLFDNGRTDIYGVFLIYCVWKMFKCLYKAMMNQFMGWSILIIIIIKVNV